jgi:hypothetical protein
VRFGKRESWPGRIPKLKTAQLMKRLFERFTAPTPAFWRKIRNYALILTTAAAGGMALPTGETLHWLLEHTAVVGFILGLVAQLAAPDQKDGK